jgi:hypothetical protein
LQVIPEGPQVAFFVSWFLLPLQSDVSLRMVPGIMATGYEFSGNGDLPLFNVQLSFVIGGGASRSYFSLMSRRRRIRKLQMTIEH